MDRDLTADRVNYAADRLVEADASPDPIEFFGQWLDQARACDQIEEANAMTLSTVHLEAGSLRPSARVVLLKEVVGGGFHFYSNYESAKGRQLEVSPWAALTFWWPALQRQVRIEGRVDTLSREAAEAYFAVRPRGSQLGAWASHQSKPIESADVLAEQYAEAEERLADQDVPCPTHWGGYRVQADRIEFWQGRPSRLHDRLDYRLVGGTWQRVRLQP